MSWDIFIQDLPNVRTANDIPNDFKPQPIGGREDLLKRIVVHVHGGDQSAASVAAVLRELGLRGMDTATGDLFDAATLEEGL